MYTYLTSGFLSRFNSAFSVSYTALLIEGHSHSLLRSHVPQQHLDDPPVYHIHH